MMRPEIEREPYKGYHVTFDSRRLMFQWRASRFGVNICAMSERELREKIDRREQAKATKA